MSDQEIKKPAEKITDSASHAARAESEPAPVRRHRAMLFQVALVLVVALEGIILGKGTARIKVLPRTLRVIAPGPGIGAEKPPEKTTQDLPATVSPVSK